MVSVICSDILFIHLEVWTKREFRCLECCDFKETVHPDSKLEKPLCTVFNLFGWLSVLATFAAGYHV
jgi:hypothetical protein